MTSPSPDAGLVEQVKALEKACNQARLALAGMVSVQSAIDLLDCRPLGVSEALTAQQQEPVGEVEIADLHRRIYLAETNRDDWRERAKAAEARISTLEAQLVEAREGLKAARTQLMYMSAPLTVITRIDAALNKDETGGAGA